MPQSSSGSKGAKFGFGSSTSRFDVRGVGHPNSKAPGTCLSATYNPNSIQPFADHSLGPGSHNFRMNDTQDAAEYRTTTDDRDFWTKDPRSVLQTRVSGGKGESWISPRVYQTTAARRKMKGEAVGRAREILRKTWSREAGARGPGYYIEDVSAVAFDDRKIDPSISRPGPRMKRPNRDHAMTPGPGTYGKDGVPAARFDRTLDKSQPNYSSPTKLGIMSAEGRKEKVKRGKDGVAPGQYHTEAPVVRSATGNKGPYELMTGERFILNKKKDASLGPGQYTIKSMAQKKEHLSFSKDGPRFPNVPGDQFTNASLAHYPRDTKQPNPGRYNPDRGGIGTGKRLSTRAAPFDRSASRDDQRECYKTKDFNGNIFKNTGHALAPNQYMMQRDWRKGEEGDGSSGAKTSGTAKYTRTYNASVDSHTGRFGAMQGGR